MNFFHHKHLGNHLLQLCPKVVKHPVYIYIHIHTYTHKYTYTYIHIHTHTYTHIYIHIHIYIYIYIYIHMYVCLIISFIKSYNAFNSLCQHNHQTPVQYNKSLFSPPKSRINTNSMIKSSEIN